MPCSFGLLPHRRSGTGVHPNGPRSDRGRPSDTAHDRCLWHVGGTAGTNNDPRAWRRRLQLGQRARSVSGDHRIVGKSREGLRQRVESPHPPTFGTTNSNRPVA
jgi:hypothetical protein